MMNNDIWDEICSEMAKAQDKLLFNELKEKGKIVEPVLICNPKAKYLIETRLPYHFNILATDLCEENKIYMVTDKDIADNIRQNLEWLRLGMEATKNDT